MSAINPKMLIAIIIESLVLALVLFLAAGAFFWFYCWIFLIFVVHLACSHYSVGGQAQSRMDKRTQDRVQT